MGSDPMCRTCQTMHGLINIFDEENKELIVMLSRVAHIFIKEDDQLPKQICLSCANSLQMAFEFVVQSQKTDKILRAKLDEIMCHEETPPKSPNNSDDDRVSVQIGTTEGIIVKSVLNHQSLDEIMSHEETPPKSPKDTDEDNVSTKIEPIAGFIVQTVFNQDGASIVTIEKYPEDDGLSEQYIDSKEIEFNVDDIIEVDEDYVEETSVVDFDNYIEECTDEAMTQDTTAALQADIVEPLAKSSTKSKRKSKLKTKKPPRIKPRKKYPCPFCSATFIKYAEFNAHKKSHGRYRYACKHCDKKFSSNDKLKTHMETHNGSKVSCHLCDKQCSNRGNLRRHIRQCHDKVRPYSCEVCGAQFSRKSSMKVHAATHSEERFACDECDKTFNTPTTLNLHKRSHRPDFDKEWRKKYYKGCVCEYCGKKSKSKGNHLQHIKIHSDVKDFECEVCHKGFHSKISYENHMRIHTGERPYICDICGKGFRQLAHVRKHKLAIHEPEAARRFTCRFCDKRFTCNESLKVHERLHTGEKPYKCDACPLAFIDLNGLKRHRRKVHSIDTPNTRKVVVLDELNSVTIHESDIGQLNTCQRHIVGEQDIVID